MNAIILRLATVRDQDAIVDLLTDNDQLITAYANHYKSTRNFPNGLEVFSVYEINCTQSNAKMARLSSALCVQSFPKLTHDLCAYACACSSLETVASISNIDAPPPELFKTLLTLWAAMQAAPDMANLALAWFEIHILDAYTAMPNLDLCAECAMHLEVSTYFQQELGFLCKTCTHESDNIQGFILPALRKLRGQSLTQTLSKALSAGKHAQRTRILLPLLKILASIIQDSGARKNLKAHNYLFEVFPSPMD